uniref:Uncharacterized protein n=1 Tax=Mycena chlorophos TaxID=658473 RepID=A0ABQ0L070_MYCCL|nr:predicted protein [Mycena chlorophos]
MCSRRSSSDLGASLANIGISTLAAHSRHLAPTVSTEYSHMAATYTGILDFRANPSATPTPPGTPEREPASSANRLMPGQADRSFDSTLGTQNAAAGCSTATTKSKAKRGVANDKKATPKPATAKKAPAKRRTTASTEEMHAMEGRLSEKILAFLARSKSSATADSATQEALDSLKSEFSEMKTLLGEKLDKLGGGTEDGDLEEDCGSGMDVDDEPLCSQQEVNNMLLDDDNDDLFDGTFDFEDTPAGDIGETSELPPPSEMSGHSEATGTPTAIPTTQAAALATAAVNPIPPPLAQTPPKASRNPPTAPRAFRNPPTAPRAFLRDLEERRKRGKIPDRGHPYPRNETRGTSEGQSLGTGRADAQFELGGRQERLGGKDGGIGARKLGRIELGGNDDG